MEKETAVNLMTGYVINLNVELARQNGLTEAQIDNMIEATSDNMRALIDSLYDFAKSQKIIV